MGGKMIKTVLIADDDPVSRKKLCRILQRLGFSHVEEAENGDKALAKIKELSVDLVMADWHMPGLNGLDLLKSIREDETLKNTLVYLVTNEGRQAQIVAAIQAGATGYIMKPFSQESIKEKLGEWVSQEAENPDIAPAQETQATPAS